MALYCWHLFIFTKIQLFGSVCQINLDYHFICHSAWGCCTVWSQSNTSSIPFHQAAILAGPTLCDSGDICQNLFYLHLITSDNFKGKQSFLYMNVCIYLYMHKDALYLILLNPSPLKTRSADIPGFSLLPLNTFDVFSTSIYTNSNS